MTSAWSITESVNPPRAAFLDFPLGHTAGRPDNVPEQLAIMRATLDVFASAEPGTIRRLPFRWAETDDWKAAVMTGHENGAEADDDRVARFDTPQYQTPEDATKADPGCPSCIWLTD